MRETEHTCKHIHSQSREHKDSCVHFLTLKTPRVLPLYYERVLLLHGEVRVDFNGIIFILQLQQLLPAFICHQLAIIDDICAKREENIIIINTLLVEVTHISRGHLVLTVTCRAAFSVDGKLA